ncbi:MAG: tRNA lysidine(34) synthetase TilS [Vicinamibacterales bacterium]
MATRATRDPLLARVLDTARTRELVVSGERVLVALSGGPDSVVLVHALSSLAAELGLTLVGVAHFNHQLRPTAADDEAFCRAFAADRGLACDVERAPIASIAASRRRSIEDVARAERYAFLERARVRLGATRIAVGHTKTDQAETLLLRLFRGSGTLGLAGIFPVNGRIVRPLIDVEREDVERYRVAHALPMCQDESNADPRFARNRVRHDLLPFLRRAFTPAVVDVLAREADLLRDDAVWLEAISTERLHALLSGGKDGVVGLSLDALAQEPRPIRRRLLRGALRMLAGDRFIGWAQVSAVESLIRRGKGALDLPGQRVSCVDGRMELRRQTPRGRGTRRRRADVVVSDVSDQPARLAVPGQVDWRGWRITAELAEAPADVSGTRTLEMVSKITDPSEWGVCLDIGRVGRPLFVRSRRAGDRMTIAGVEGRKKLQDLFVDRKIPKSARDDWPMVVEGDDRIIWVAGLATAADFRSPGGATGVIFLKAKRLGG